MPWFNVDDGMHCHPKVLVAGNAAIGLWSRLGSYSAAYSTEGRIPAEIVKAYGSRGEVDKLVAAGLIHRDGDAYQMHDFLDYNRDAVQVARDRAKAAERKRRQRERDRDRDDEQSHGGSHGVTAGVTAHGSHGYQDQHQDQTGTTGPAKDHPTPRDDPGDGGICGQLLDQAAKAYGQLALEQAKRTGQRITSDSAYRNSATKRIRNDSDLHRLAAMFPTAAASSIAAAVLTGDTRPLAPHAKETP